MAHKSRIGQNFLKDTAAMERIASALGDLSTRTVVEIGPGRGAITHALAARAAHVVAVELDEILAALLQTEFPAEKLTVVREDVLKFDLAAASRQYGGPLALVGNLPYYITSPILLKLAENHAHLDVAVLMVQREVSERVTAQPSSRDYGLLSVTAQMYGPVQQLFVLPPEAFSPPPEVHSAVFRWRFAPRFVELGVQEDSFLRFVRQAFAQKRKTLANNLRAAGFSNNTIAAALEEAGLPGQVRAEAISIEDLAHLARLLATDSGQLTAHSE
jgi:16S rRNA (adenine1518-N6/adenine1519-N6)-dimethyltransferase